MRGTHDSVGTLLSMHPRATAMVCGGACGVAMPRGMRPKRAVRMGIKRGMPLSKFLLRSSTSFGATTLAKRDIPQALCGRRRILTKVVTSSGIMQVGMGGPCSRDALTHVLALMRSTTREGTPTRLFVHHFTQVCAPVIAKLTVLIIVLPCLCSLVGPRFVFIFSS